MWSLLKDIFANKCPHCNQPLKNEQTDLGYIKFCPDGHYEEESNYHLGVTITYSEHP